MADLTITEVRLSDDSSSREVVAAEAVSIGDVVYRDITITGSEANMRRASAGAIETSLARGIALTPAIVGGKFQIVESGNIILAGAGMNPKFSLVLSASPGKIALEADLVATNYVTNIGRPVSTDEAWLSIRALSVQVP